MKRCCLSFWRIFLQCTDVITVCTIHVRTSIWILAYRLVFTCMLKLVNNLSTLIYCSRLHTPCTWFYCILMYFFPGASLCDPCGKSCYVLGTGTILWIIALWITDNKKNINIENTCPVELLAKISVTSTIDSCAFDLSWFCLSLIQGSK